MKKGPSYDLLNLDEIKNIHIGEDFYPFHASTVSGMSLRLFLRNIYGLFKTFFSFKKFSLDGYDTVYLNSTCLGFYAYMIRRRFPKVRIICHVREPLLSGVSAFILRRFCSSIDQFVAISKYDASSLLYLENRSVVIPNYVNIYNYKKSNGKSAISKNTCFSVGFFARLDEKNGVLDFIRLAEMMIDNHNIKFYIFGYTGLESKKVKKKLLSLPGNVCVEEMVSDVVGVLSDLDVLVCPFLIPHFSRSVVEAAAVKTPSIIYDVGSVNELVLDGDTGYKVPVGELLQVQEKIQFLCENTDVLHGMGDRARLFVEREFSERNAEKIISLI